VVHRKAIKEREMGENNKEGNHKGVRRMSVEKEYFISRSISDIKVSAGEKDTRRECF
jgi:hypothetical protein